MQLTSIKPNIIAHKLKAGVSRIPSIKNIIAITSGKGGVGKSTSAINLAITLAKQGLKIGLLDADIYGPSLPILIGATDYKPEVSLEQNFIPLTKYQIKVMSIGFLVPATTATIWRGAMVLKALEQMLYDTAWGELDILIMDLPPGTGDIQLTLAQKMPITATVVITTPQDVALLDVAKSINMFEKLDIPCLGIVENMATHLCTNCGQQSDIFGHGASQKLKQEYNLDLLAKLPLTADICLSSDQGIPLTSLDNHPLMANYQELADNLLLNLAKLAKDYSSKLASITIKTN